MRQLLRHKALNQHTHFCTVLPFFWRSLCLTLWLHMHCSCPFHRLYFSQCLHNACWVWWVFHMQTASIHTILSPRLTCDKTICDNSAIGECSMLHYIYTMYSIRNVSALKWAWQFFRCNKNCICLVQSPIALATKYTILYVCIASHCITPFPSLLCSCWATTAIINMRQDTQTKIVFTEESYADVKPVLTTYSYTEIPIIT